MTGDAPPLIGASVEFFPAADDQHVGIRPAIIEAIEDEETGIVTLEVYDRGWNGTTRAGVMPETDWLMRAALDPEFDSDLAAHWAWSE